MRLSILIPSKGRPEQLRRAVGCALAQTWPDVEVIVQDGSDTPTVLSDDPRLQYVNEPDTGIANGLNRAAARATGDVLHFACDDDLMHADTAADALAAIDAGYAWTAGRIIVEGPPLPGRRVEDEELHGGEPWNPRVMMIGNVIPQPATFFTRCVFDEAGGFDESLRLCVDYELWGRIGRCYEPAIRQHIDATYHRWPGSASVVEIAELHREAEIIRARWREHGFGWRP